MKILFILLQQSKKSPGFKEAVEKSHIPFSDGKVADRIYEVIRLVNLEGLPDKKFYDI